MPPNKASDDNFLDFLAVAQNCKRAEWEMGITITRAYDKRKLDVDDVRSLLLESQIGTHVRPSAATAWRYIAKWRATLAELTNNGGGN